MEVEKSNWLDMSLDDRIKAKRKEKSEQRKTGKTAQKRQRASSVPGKRIQRGEKATSKRTKFSIIIDNDGSRIPGAPYGAAGKARRSRNRNRASPYEDNRKSRRSALEDAEASGHWKHDLFTESRGGDNGRGGPKLELSTSSVVTVSNIPWDVDAEDLDELFSGFKFYKRTEILFDRSGRSEGVALVHFSKRAAGRDFVAEYNDVKLDGRRMKVEFGDVSADRVSSRGQDEPTKPRVTELKTRGRGKPKFGQDSSGSGGRGLAARLLVKH